jgi:ABC-type transport system involved in multi-copper enzyme maturation permease subunit
MYLWKCWRDTRYPFLAACALFVAAFAFYTFVARDPFGWFADSAWGVPRSQWQLAADITLRVVSVLSVFAGVLLAGDSICEEFPKKTLPFLLSRPRGRAYFVWSNWVVGAVQSVFLVAFAFFLHQARPGFATGPVLPFRFEPYLKMAAALGTIALVLYTLTFLFGMLFRSGRNGIRAAFGFAVLYLLLTQAFALPLPTFERFMNEASLSTSNPAKHAYPFLLNGSWITFALALTTIAHISFRQHEP